MAGSRHRRPHGWRHCSTPVPRLGSSTWTTFGWTAVCDGTLAINPNLKWDAKGEKRVQGPGFQDSGLATDRSPLIFHASAVLFQHLSSNAVFCYAAAALILGVAALTAGMWRVEEMSQVTTAAAPPNAAPLLSQEVNGSSKVERVCVGSVSGMSNCVWRGSHTLASCAAKGSIELVSGTVEVSYRTGVKVLIEGPALYVVNSLNGGYLGSGKLSVSVDRKSQTHDRNSGRVADRGALPGTLRPQSQPLGPLFPAFTVQTPNADLDGRDADFTVSVNILGECYTRVLRGRVGVAVMPESNEEAPVFLDGGQSAVLGLNVKGEPTLYVGRGEPPLMFARGMPRGGLPVYSGEGGTRSRRKASGGKGESG